MIRRLVIAAALVATAAACTPPTTTPSGPVAPKVRSFAPAGGPFVAPAEVPLAWKVSDANGDALTCRLDREDDGIWDVTITGCQSGGGVGSRIVTAPSDGGNTARFEVTDGTFTATATTVYVVEPEVTTEPFDVQLRPLGTIEPDALAAFETAAARWSQSIVRGVADQPVTLDPGQCLDDEPGGTVSVDDLLLTIQITAIDGVGGVLGQAGPCVLSSSDDLTRAGIMQFDSADVANLLASDTFTAVVIHEMGHTLGIGTLWEYGSRDLLTGAGGSNPRYTGARGVAEWSTLGGTSTVPVENTGGAGTADSHWREATFDTELMTGWIDAGPIPMSALTVSSLGDLGYSVDRDTADAYSLPGGAARAPGPSGQLELGTILRPPITEQ